MKKLFFLLMMLVSANGFSQNYNQVFTKTANIGTARISAANTARDGSGSNIATVLTCAANGTLIYRITVTASDPAASTSVAQVVNVWDYTGSAYFLYQQLLMPATAGANATKGGTVSYTIPGGYFCPTGHTFRAAATLGSSTTGQVDVVIEGADY